jgi:plasmid stability protein
MQNASMPVQLTIRDVPERVRDELAARAARAGKSMQEYLRNELEKLAGRPQLDQWIDEVRRRKAAAGRRLSARRILSEREADRR